MIILFFYNKIWIVDDFYFDLYQHRSRTKKTGFYDTIHSFFQTSFFITMKKLTILAAALFATGAAYAQGPTNQYTGWGQRTLPAPVNTHSANPTVNGANAGVPSNNYNSYNQDSYINQAGNGNYATVDQSDSRVPANNGGSTAILNQSGNNNNASQKQTLVLSTFSNSGAYGSRDFMKATQAGSSSQVNQTQNGGGFNTMNVTQGAGTTGNRAIQTQNVDAAGGGDGNQATINQVQYLGAGGSGNRAEQTQSGVLETAQIDQQGTNGYAKQTQVGGTNGQVNNSYIGQGAPGNANTAIQSQNGTNNTSRILQSVGAGNAGSNNYALQNQTNNNNQADIIQNSSRNYAEQQQVGNSNYSSMTQSNVVSAAYSIQSGNNNSAIVVQH